MRRPPVPARCKWCDVLVYLVGSRWCDANGRDHKCESKTFRVVPKGQIYDHERDGL